MQIIPAKPEDAAVLSRIAMRAKRHWGYPESWIECWRDVLTVRPESILRQDVHAALVDEAIVGFYALEADGLKLCLEHLWVIPEAMGRGVGRRLFVHALNRAKERGFASLEIESDPNAEGFYLRMGACRAGVRLREVAGHRRELPVLVCEITSYGAETHERQNQCFSR